jgi:hypothetical protein
METKYVQETFTRPEIIPYSQFRSAEIGILGTMFAVRQVNQNRASQRITNEEP